MPYLVYIWSRVGGFVENEVRIRNGASFLDIEECREAGAVRRRIRSFLMRHALRPDALTICHMVR